MLPPPIFYINLLKISTFFITSFFENSLQIKSAVFLTFIFSTFSVVTNAQSKVLSAGGNATGNSGSVSYSVGQIDYASTSVSNKGSIGLGVQQPLIISPITGIKGSERLTISCNIHPNPSSDFVVLGWDASFEVSSVNYKIADINGKNIVSATAQNQTKIEVSNFATGMYIITVYDTKNKFIKSFNLIKN
ncbi:MAG: T9SS C-terminal target domain-containing protein [Bacteroidetes bacterium]|nr:MAG: T9SS C-terminal target domain-containing protein [Bacteroidota bacterium]